MKNIITALLLAFSLPVFAQVLQVKELTCEHKINPSGIDMPQPRLSWKLAGTGRNLRQSAYSIRVATDKSFAKNTLVWETGKTASSQSLLLPYGGKPLQSGTPYYWQVKIWDGNNKETVWSEPAFWITGLSAADWKSSWIEPAQNSLRKTPAMLLRKGFSLDKKIASARAYVTSHGFYELYINGQKVGDEVLTPGWTSYKTRLQYQVYDIAPLLKKGGNAVGAMLGDGWYKGTLAWGDNWGVWGKRLGLLCQLEIVYTDGSKQTIGTDASWKSTQTGPLILNGIYDGETYDARKEIDNWASGGFDDSQWRPVTVANFSKDNLIATQTVPVKKIETLTPVKIFRTPKGTLVADMGQNMVGWIKLKVSGPAGTEVTIRHAEVLDKYGEFYTDNLRAATATARYILKGGGEETYEPRFSFFGFRYVALDGFPGDLKPENLTGVVVHSDMRPTGSFTCSNPLINQLQHNIRWGQKGNFLDVPTDCPQRDERLGWTGDAQAFVRTAAFNMNVAAFFAKWLKDVAADQGKDGRVPNVIPDALRDNGTSAGWGDVATIAPWTIYQVFGDSQILANQYASMKAWVDFISSKAGESHLWKGGSMFGDWLFYKSMRQTENDGYTSPDMIATLFYAYSSKLLAQAAAVLGHVADENKYHTLFDNIATSFNKNYVTAEGRIASESQTAYVLALHFGVLPEALRPKATQYLVEDIQGRGNHLSTGFLGTPYLCHVLTANGRTDVAYDLLLQETFPSWLYPVKMGATTIWERWDGQKTDSSFQDVGMNSFNHYAYGAIGDWMYRVVAGIEIGAPGYKHILIQPQPSPKLSHAKAEFESGYGTIRSGWETKDGKTIYSISIPANTTATVTLPKATLANTALDSKPLGSSISTARQAKENMVLEIGSGDYVFEVEN